VDITKQEAEKAKQVKAAVDAAAARITKQEAEKAKQVKAAVDAAAAAREVVAGKWDAADKAEEEWNTAKAAADTAYGIALAVTGTVIAAVDAKAAADAASRQAAAIAHEAWLKYTKLKTEFQNARDSTT